MPASSDALSYISLRLNNMLLKTLQRNTRLMTTVVAALCSRRFSKVTFWNNLFCPRRTSLCKGKSRWREKRPAVATRRSWLWILGHRCNKMRLWQIKAEPKLNSDHLYHETPSRWGNCDDAVLSRRQTAVFYSIHKNQAGPPSATFFDIRQFARRYFLCSAKNIPLASGVRHQAMERECSSLRLTTQNSRSAISWETHEKNFCCESMFHYWVYTTIKDCNKYMVALTFRKAWKRLKGRYRVWYAGPSIPGLLWSNRDCVAARVGCLWPFSGTASPPEHGPSSVLPSCPLEKEIRSCR